MSPIQQEQLADLGGHPGWRVLLALLAEGENALLEQAQFASQTVDLVRFTRTWQTFKTLRQALESAPQNAAEQLLHLSAETQERFGFDEAWLSRSVAAV